MHRQQIRITRNNHIRPPVQRDFYEPSVLGSIVARLGFAPFEPWIRPYSSADTTIDASRFFRRMSTGPCWTASRSAPKRFRAAVTVMAFIYPFNRRN
jgi:hypothetical protein